MTDTETINEVTDALSDDDDTGQGNAFVLTRFLQPLKHLLAHDPDDGQVQLRSVEATPKHAENGPDER